MAAPFLPSTLPDASTFNSSFNPFFASPGPLGTNVIGSYPLTGSGTVGNPYTGNIYDPYGLAFGGSRPASGYRDVPPQQVPSADIYGSVEPSPALTALTRGTSLDPPSKQADGSNAWFINNGADKADPFADSVKSKSPDSGLLGFGAFNNLFGSQPLQWQDIHTPLPTFTPYPSYVSPGKYNQPYTKQGLADEKGAYLNQIGALEGYKGDLAKFQKLIAKLPSLEGKAHSQALSDVHALEKSIHAQQAEIEHQGVLNNQALLAAGRAGAQLQMGIGSDVLHGYQSTAQAVQSLAAGVAGGLQGASAANLAAIAGHLPGGTTLAPNVVPGVPTSSFATAPGNALFQQMGQIPAGTNLVPGTKPGTAQPQGLLAQGLASQRSIEQGAQSLLGAGRQTGLLALAGAEQASRALEPQIVDAYNKLPAQTRANLSTLTDERNQWINQQLQLLVQKGQISVQEAAASSDFIKTNVAQEAANASAKNSWQISTTASKNAYDIGKTAAANQFAQTIATIQGSDIRANATGRISALAANNAARQRAISAWLTYQSNAMKAAGKGGLTAYQIDRAAGKLGPYLKTAYAGDLGRSTSTNAGTTTTVNTVKAQPIPIQDAFRNVQTEFPGLTTALGPEFIAGLVASAYQVPWWTPQQVALGEGPLNLQPGAPSGPPSQPSYPADVYTTKPDSEEVAQKKKDEAARKAAAEG